MAPTYPGSDSERLFVYPYPYWDYRSPSLHLHHEHLRAKWPPGSRLRFGLGANGSPPVQAGTPDARRGMASLAPTFAIGPNVIYKLPWRPLRFRTTIGVRMRYRTALDPGLQLAGLGSSVSAFVHWRSRQGTPWPVALSLGPVWRSREVNNYFFGVPVAAAAPGRPAYEAPAGYAGLRLTAAISTVSGPLRVTLFGRYRNYRGAVFSASPLLKASSTLILGVAVVWVFIRSHPEGRS